MKIICFRGRALIIRLWPLAIRWTWPVRTPGGFGCGQLTTQVGYSWPAGPAWPLWTTIDQRAAWMDHA